MDTDATKERKALREAHVKLETYLKENGFEWESNFQKAGYACETYSKRPLVVKLCWDHTPKR